MSDSVHRPHCAGEPITDLCRACKVERDHTVMAVDEHGRAARVVCDFCGSQHNYRGGGDDPHPAAGTTRHAPAAPRLRAEHEGTVPVSTIDTPHDLESVLRRIVREELGLTPGAPAPKWRGGQVLLRPGKPGLQENASLKKRT